MNQENHPSNTNSIERNASDIAPPVARSPRLRKNAPAQRPPDQPSSVMPLTAADQARLDALHAQFESLRPFSIGYPCNLEFDYSPLFRFLAFASNNVGDPFSGSNYRLNTHEFEREVVADFARHTKAPEGDYWGYVTNGDAPRPTCTSTRSTARRVDPVRDVRSTTRFGSGWSSASRSSQSSNHPAGSRFARSVA